MKYQCGHNGCDVCGARECAPTKLIPVGDYRVCDYCLRLSVDFSVKAAEMFGGTVIDVSKPCGHSKGGDK